eukprot:8155771-Ditylum_brightwellii.AAC.1
MHNSSADTPAERPRKKIMIQIDNNFPALPTSNNGQQDNQSVGTESQWNTGGMATTVSENTIKEMNEQFKAQLQDLKNVQEMKMVELEDKTRIKLQNSISTVVENSIQLFSTSIASMVEASFKQKMDTQLQPSLNWIKAQITATNNSMAMF